MGLAAMFRRYARVLSPFVLSLTFVLFTGCGSGSTGAGSAPQPDFSVSMSPSSLTVLAGSTTTFQITAQALNGFNDNLTIVVNGGPVGITTTPSLPITTSPTSSQTIKVTCASSVAVGSYPLQLTATAGTLKH